MHRKQLLGRCVECVFCYQQIKYAWFTGMSVPTTHFYAESNNDVITRADWAKSVISAIHSGASDFDLVFLCNTFLNFNHEKKYAIWNNVKCPKCKTEFPYRFKGNLKIRLTEPEIILFDGCVVDSDQGLYVVDVLL